MGRVFFFAEASSGITEWFSDLFKGGGTSSENVRRYGWYIMTKGIAETGAFNTNEYQGMEAVEKSNLYDVLRFALVDKAEGEARKDQK